MKQLSSRVILRNDSGWQENYTSKCVSAVCPLQWNRSPDRRWRIERSMAAFLFALVFVLGTVGEVAQAQVAALEERSKAMSERVDQLLEEQMRELHWEPAGPCDDAAFLRRAHLDLSGTPPSGRQVLAFVADSSENKRMHLVDQLVSSPASHAYLASTWASWMLPEDSGQNPFGDRNAGLENWLRDRFAENLRYDRLVADLLVATGSTQNGPTAFFVALEGKPEKLAAKTARVFMGVQLDCAECHDHPFDDWKQQDFWGLAAYFARVSAADTPTMASVTDLEEGEVMIPDTSTVVAPKPLVNTGFSGLDSGTRRQQLTLWLTARENPFLARATVNRVWALLFGQGLIEPVDDMRSLEMASHPQLLSELSDYFASTDYNLRALIATLAKTRAYGRSTLHTRGKVPRDSYATMAVKPLTQLQLATSLEHVGRQIAGPNAEAMRGLLQRQLGILRGEASEAKLGIVSALVTLHGNSIDTLSRPDSSRLLKALDAPFMDEEKQLRWLFLSVLNRLPSDDEIAGIAKGIRTNQFATTEVSASAANNASPTADSDQVASGSESWQSDLLWALLNSSEFAMTP
ncbi:MAG: DUF1549 domain-containing protein [Planctomycetales bacterium]|nr:DUF1549 domain-containing protein [Planctomycetales bacterium]